MNDNIIIIVATFTQAHTTYLVLYRLQFDMDYRLRIIKSMAALIMRYHIDTEPN